jgi:hypothetical protein
MEGHTEAERGGRTPTHADYINEALHVISNTLMITALCVTFSFSVYVWSACVWAWSLYDVRLTWLDRFGNKEGKANGTQR